MDLSRPARCSLTLQPARSADPLKGPFLAVLQVIRRLLTRPECFRLEREFAGPDFHRGGWRTLARRTKQRLGAGVAPLRGLSKDNQRLSKPMGREVLCRHSIGRRNRAKTIHPSLRRHPPDPPGPLPPLPRLNATRGDVSNYSLRLHHQCELEYFSAKFSVTRLRCLQGP